MKSILRSFHRKVRADTRGATIVILTFFVVALFGFAALSIDVANVLREQRKENVATDAAAIAGLAKLGDPLVSTSQQAADAIAEAQLLANTNGVTDVEIAAGARNGYPGQIQVGQWTNGVFAAGLSRNDSVGRAF
jgi:Flp pilus assembly protein TadG